MASVDVPLDAGDFRLVDRQVIDALKQVRELHRFVRGLTCWVGFSQSAVHYERAPRHAGADQVPGLEVDAARVGRDHVLLEHPAALDDA